MAEVAGKTFWTFSVWENRGSLDEFARSSPHNQIIRSSGPGWARRYSRSRLPMDLGSLKAGRK